MATKTKGSDVVKALAQAAQAISETELTQDELHEAQAIQKELSRALAAQSP